jgi:hypothetical protein
VAVEAYSDIPGSSDSSQTPRLVVGRYAAHRRIQAQRELENSSQSGKEKSMPDEPREGFRSSKFQVNKTVEQQVETYPLSTPQPTKLRTETNASPSSISPHISSEPGTKTVKPVAGKGQKPPEEGRKRSNIVVFLLKKLFRTTMTDVFERMRRRGALKKVKVTRFGQLLMVKIRATCNRVLHDCCAVAFAKINKISNAKNIKQPNTKKVNKTEIL